VSTQLAPVEEMMQRNGSQVAVLHRISNIVSSDESLDDMLHELVGLTMQREALYRENGQGVPLRCMDYSTVKRP